MIFELGIIILGGIAPRSIERTKFRGLECYLGSDRLVTFDPVLCISESSLLKCSLYYCIVSVRGGWTRIMIRHVHVTKMSIPA